jgi:heme exporter protein D
MNVVWRSFAEFAAMGGYATYVWGSMGAVALALGAEVLSLRARKRAIRRDIALAASARRHTEGQR